MSDKPKPKRTILLLAVVKQFPALAGVDQMTWADAELSGYERFGLFDRIIATPPQFPDRKGEQRRPEMIGALRRRINGGAHAVFLIPPFSESKSGPRSPFHRAEHLLREVTGARLDERIEPKAMPLEFDPAAPPSIHAFLDRYKPDVVVRVPTDPFGLGTQPPHIDLAGFSRLNEDPCVVAGFPGEGTWIALPWSPRDFDEREIIDVLALLDDVAVLRAIHEQRLAAPPVVTRRSATAVRRERPTPDSDIGAVLEQLELANGGFVVLRRKDDKNIHRLKVKYGIPIENARAARARGAKIPKTARGYRLVLPQ